MAILNMFGMETGNLTEFDSTTITGSGTITNIATDSTTGNRCLQTVGGTSATAYATIRGIAADGANNVNFGITTIYMSFAYKAATSSTNHQNVSFKSAAGNEILNFNSQSSGGGILYMNITGTTTGANIQINTNQWYYVHIICASNATCYLFIEGVGSTSVTGNNFTIDKIEIGSLTNTTISNDKYDDIVISNTDMPTHLKITHLTPAGDISNTMNSGGFADVDEIPSDGATTVTSSGDPLAKDLRVNMTSASAAGIITNNILAVKINVTCAVTSGAGVNVIGIGDGIAYDHTGTFDPGATYESRCKIRETSPDTILPWTITNINNLRIKMAHNNGAEAINFSQAIAEVVYAPFSPKNRNMTGVGF